MNKILHQITEEFYQKVMGFFENEDQISIDAAEQEFRNYSNTWLCGMLKAYYEQMDEEILMDKTGRKAEGLVFER